MLNSKINKGDFLTRVQRYELNREEGRIFIDVHEVIVGETKARFLANPNLMLKNAREKYIGKGNSEKEALSDCLSLIRDVSNSDIFED